MSVYFQILCTLIISTLGINMGLLINWPASTLTLFASNNTTLNRPMTEMEIGLVGSLSSVGGLVSTLAGSYLLDKLGRKYCSIVSALGLAMSWAILVSCDRVEVVLIGAFATGFGAISFLVGAIYCGEICKESIRGAMMSVNMTSYGVGLLLSYILGGYLEYHVMLYVGLSLAVLGVVVLFLLKETPLYLMSLGREEEAAESIAFYRRLKPGSKEITKELNNLRRALSPELVDTPETEKLNPNSHQKEKLSVWQFLKKSQSTRQILFVNLVVSSANVLQGPLMIQTYAEVTFREAIPGFSPNLCSIIMAIVTIISGLVGSYLTEYAGRRPLMIYGSLTLGICCVVLGTQIQLHWGPDWVTAIFIYLYNISFTCGAGTVPYVLIAETFLPEIKSFASMVVMEWLWVWCAFAIFIFHPLLCRIGLGSIFYIFAASGFFTSIFCVFFLPETKNLPVDAIQLLFTKKRKSQEFC